MPYQKRIICLANSKKPSGRCVAGIEITPAGLRDWIRPISARPSEELSERERAYENGKDVALLDIVDIHLNGPRPHACQRENHVIDDTVYWELAGRASPSDLMPALQLRGPLWLNGGSSYSGENDRILVAAADVLTSSLTLIRVTRPQISVSPGLKGRQVRLRFAFDGASYNLRITDPSLEQRFLAKKDGDYPYDGDMLVCVSIGEPWEGYRYKLAAGLIAL